MFSVFEHSHTFMLKQLIVKPLQNVLIFVNVLIIVCSRALDFNICFIYSFHFLPNLQSVLRKEKLWPAEMRLLQTLSSSTGKGEKKWFFFVLKAFLWFFSFRISALSTDHWALPYGWLHVTFKAWNWSDTCFLVLVGVSWKKPEPSFLNRCLYLFQVLWLQPNGKGWWRMPSLTWQK